MSENDALRVVLRFLMGARADRNPVPPELRQRAQQCNAKTHSMLVARRISKRGARNG